MKGPLSRSGRLKLAATVATVNAAIPAFGVLAAMLAPGEAFSELQASTFVYSAFILPGVFLWIVVRQWRPAWRRVPLAVAIGPLVLLVWGLVGGAAFGELAVAVSNSSTGPINASQYATPAALERAMVREEYARGGGGLVSFWFACASASFLLTRFERKQQSPKVQEDA